MTLFDYLSTLDENREIEVLNAKFEKVAICKCKNAIPKKYNSCDVVEIDPEIMTIKPLKPLKPIRIVIKTDNKIKRDSNYIHFVSCVNSCATNKYNEYFAMKFDGVWHLIDETGKSWLCPIGILRAIIGQIITQANVDYPLETWLKYGA